MGPNTPPLGLFGLSAGALTRRVTHIRLSRHFNALYIPSYEHITDLAGPDWVRTRAQVVADIENGWQYYTDGPFVPRAYLEVMPPKSLLGDKYVRTKPDCATVNNLLNLPHF